MNIDDFILKLIDLEQRAPAVTLMIESAHVHTGAELEDAESRLGIEVPQSYAELLKTRGFGYFGTHEIYSLRSKDRYSYLGDKSTLSGLPISQFLPISDDGTGRFFGYRMSDGTPISDEIFATDATSAAAELQLRSSSIFDFIWTVALHDWTAGHLKP